VDLLTIDGTRTPIGDGRLIGLMQPAATAAEGLPDQVSRGRLRIVRVTSNGDYSGGPGIEVVVHNDGPEDVPATIPCGFIFEPDDASDQRLMAVQRASVVVPAGGEATLTVYVVCIDSGDEAPDEGATYRLGTMQSGDLLKLAECACGENLTNSLNPFEGMGVMIAGWMISNGKTFSEMQAEGDQGAMGDAFGEGAQEAMSGFLQMLDDSSASWLDRCGIPHP
jgi:hypothetical protein